MIKKRALLEKELQIEIQVREQLPLVVCQLLRTEGATRSAQPVPTSVIPFIDWSHYFLFQVAPQLQSRGWVHPIPDPLLLT
jgi:hypothetical protein